MGSWVVDGELEVWDVVFPKLRKGIRFFSYLPTGLLTSVATSFLIIG